MPHLDDDGVSKQQERTCRSLPTGTGAGADCVATLLRLFDEARRASVLEGAPWG